MVHHINLSSIFTKNEVPSNSSPGAPQCSYSAWQIHLILNPKFVLSWSEELNRCFSHEKWHPACCWRFTSNPKNKNYGLAAVKKKQSAFLLNPEYQFRQSPTCNHLRCSRKRSSAGLHQPTPHRAAEQLLTCWCRESAQGRVPCSYLPAKSWQNMTCFLQYWRTASQQKVQINPKPPSLFVFLL